MANKDYNKYLQKSDLEIAGEEYQDISQGYKGDLGVKYCSAKTSFRLWSPTAEYVTILIYEGENDQIPKFEKPLLKDNYGTWYIEIDGDLKGLYYIYQIKVDGEINKVVDPYTKGLGTNSKLGLIVDLKRTHPSGWDGDKRVKINSPQNAVIYEIHLRDFSASENSGIKTKNKYLAFTETDTISKQGLKTGLDHLKELGITHIHLQPVFDFATVDDLAEDDYNWGYDPFFYNVPEGSYSTNPSDDTRIKEFKMMVKSLHDNNLGIIMDVVYNHTYHTLESPFNKIVPGYYYRRYYDGNFSNGSGTGNEIASEKPMVRKFIIDSVKYWAEEYHIDGFRFDLMALHDKTTMLDIEKTLHNIDPSILIYGEPWVGGATLLNPEQQFVKGAQRDTRIAVFNDYFRNGIKGDNDGKGRGFVSGARHQVDSIKRGIVGSIYYNNYINSFADEPWETVNYVSSHDNLTLWDKLYKSNISDSEEIRIKMDKLAQGIVLTSQGIPFLLGGEEILRTKFGNHNSYNAGDNVNKIKWERKSIYYNVFNYYKGLIHLRRQHSAFCLKNAEEIRRYLRFLDTPYNTVGFVLAEYANNDKWKEIVVLYNPNQNTELFFLPHSGLWHVVVDERKAGTDILYNISDDKVHLSPLSMMVLYLQ